MTKYNHMMDVAFEVISDHKDNLQVSEILAGMAKRIAEIQAQEVTKPGSTLECFAFCDVYEMTEEEAKKRQLVFHY